MMPRTELLKKVEEDYLDRVVEMSKETIENTKVYENISGLEKSQLSNLQNLVNSTDSVNAIKLYIRYQMGRSKNKHAWNYNNFGKAVLTHLDNLKRMAEEISKEEHKLVHLYLIRLYCGFLVRWFVALQERRE